MRIVAISDLHLGRRSSHLRDVEAVRPLFEGADVAIINGDGVDFGWVPRDEAFRWHERLLTCLQRLVGKVVWVRGNHDLVVDGPMLHREGDVVFTHGHALFGVPPGTATFEEACQRVGEHHLRRHSTFRHGNRLVQLAESLAHRAVPLQLASRLWIGDPGRVDLSLLLAAAGPGVKEVCLGHLHVTRRVTRPEADVFVTGAWTGRAPTSAFVHEDGVSELRRVVRSSDGFHLGPAIGPVARPLVPALTP